MIQDPTGGWVGDEWYRRLERERRSLDWKLHRAAKLVASLRAEVAALREDAERYRVLRDGEGWPAVFVSCDAPEPIRGAGLDAAIEQARRETRQACLDAADAAFATDHVLNAIRVRSKK
jgi:hypothetical protein